MTLCLIQNHMKRLQVSNFFFGKYFRLILDHVSCPTNVTVVGASLTNISDSHIDGDVVMYHCVAGFENDFNGGSIVCQKNGTWSRPSKPCASK